MSYITNQWVKMNPFEAAARLNELERENAALREMLDLAFRIPNMTDAELAELIRNCRAALGTAAKEVQP